MVECGANGTFIHNLWECMMKSLWKTLAVSYKNYICISLIAQHISFLGIMPREIKNICPQKYLHRMFITVLLIIAKN